MAEEICSKHRERLTDPDASQYWIAIAGGPGSGKSTLAEALHIRVNERVGKDVSCTIPMVILH